MQSLCSNLGACAVGLILVTGFVVFMDGVGIAADSARPIPLRLAYSAMTVNQAIPWISVEAGHFKKG